MSAVATWWEVRDVAKRKTKRRAVVVAGNRTPFTKAFGPFMKMDTIALGDAAVAGLLRKTEIAYTELDAIVWGGVILPGLAPNVAREIAL